MTLRLKKQHRAQWEFSRSCHARLDKQNVPSFSWALRGPETYIFTWKLTQKGEISQPHERIPGLLSGSRSSVIFCLFTKSVQQIVDINTGETLGPHKEGEICVKGPNVMKGYFKNPKATEDTIKDDWLHTGLSFLLFHSRGKLKFTLNSKRPTQVHTLGNGRRQRCFPVFSGKH